MPLGHISFMQSLLKKWTFYFIIRFLKIHFENNPIYLFRVDLMERFMMDHNPFKDVHVWHESSLGRLHHSMRDLCEPISPDLGENFETNIKKTDGPELLNSHRLCFLICAAVFDKRFT